MRALLQRSGPARVEVDGAVVGEISAGLVVFLGVGRGDGLEQARKLARKIVQLRIFPDESHSMQRSLEDVGGRILLVSQFTLYADCRKGRRPSFDPAEAPEAAELLYRKFAESLNALGHRPEEGVFGADMRVVLENVGPVTLMLEESAAG